MAQNYMWIAVNYSHDLFFFPCVRVTRTRRIGFVARVAYMEDKKCIPDFSLEFV